MTDPIAALVLEKLVERGGVVVLDDDAVEAVVGAYGDALAAGRAVEATTALLEVAMFLDVKKGSRAAAQTLLTLCLVGGPVLRELGNARATAAAQLVADTQAKFAGFVGDDRVTRVLDSGARPAGTTAASPLARFQLQVPKK